MHCCSNKITSPTVTPILRSPNCPEESCSNVWFSDDDVKLTLQDKCVIQNNEWINDRIIYVFQLILRSQYPSLQGFQHPILSTSCGFDTMSSEFIQIINIYVCHWVTISSVGCHEGHIQWFDSLHMQPSTDTKRVIADMLQYKGDEITVDVCNVVKQAGASDCGIFALAYATAVCHGLDPTALCFDQRKLRQHVVDCIENKFVTPFPVTREHSQRKPVLFSRVQSLLHLSITR